MINGAVTNRVYTSASFTGEVVGARDVQNALFHLSAHLFSLSDREASPFGKVFEDVCDVANRYIDSQKQRNPSAASKIDHTLRHRELIRPGNDIHVIATNLREIAAHEGLCLAISGNPKITRQLAEYVKDTPIDIGEVKAAAKD